MFKRYGLPEQITTDDLRSYMAAMNELSHVDKQEVGRLTNCRKQPIAVPKGQSGRCSASSSQKFVAAFGRLFPARFMHAEADETYGCLHLGIGMM